MRFLLLTGYAGTACPHRGVAGRELPLPQKPCSPAVLARKVREILDA